MCVPSCESVAGGSGGARPPHTHTSTTTPYGNMETPHTCSPSFCARSTYVRTETQGGR